MKKRFIYSMFLLFALFLLGTVITMVYINKTTSGLKNVIELHKVEIIRQNLVINTQTVQSHLYTIGTIFGRELDEIVDNVIELDDSVNGCLGCHHTIEMTVKLNEMKDLLLQYEDALSYLITTSAGKERVERLRKVAITIGNTLLKKSQNMSLIANKSLGNKTIAALKDINSSKNILIVTLVLSFFIAIAIAVSITKQITEPIGELLKATRRIKSGELGYKTQYAGKEEFVELIDSFNDMSVSLKETNQKVVRHMHNLSDLYAISLRFHALTGKDEIFGSLTEGISDFLDVEQCGVLVLDREVFRHTSASVGMPEGSRADEELSVPKARMLRHYRSSKRRALVMNGADELDGSPTAKADRALGVRNIMFVWLVHKGAVVGAIRVANKRDGVFTEEDERLLAIVASNFAVALENAGLYENLQLQMKELKDTQEQLLQAAKLVAIGELSANVAHEINNPLTSILGYAELIKEETDMKIIMKDLDIIEKESLRARDIVHQLLEFSKKRPLEVKKININSIIEDIIGLISLQMKDTKITISKTLGDVPDIFGDGNQLKQVFLNIANNAVHAMHEEGVLGISTGVSNGVVMVVISDTGSGIPKEVIPKIFDPFFTTKKEKGTGLGLSISYKIIQSHDGTLAVQSTEGKGSRFTISLPVGA